MVHGKALLEDITGEQCVTELPDSILEKISGDKDLSVILKKTLEDVSKPPSSMILLLFFVDGSMAADCLMSSGA